MPKEKQTPRILPPKEQNPGSLYDMSMKFTATAAIPEIDNALDAMGFQEKPVLPNAVELTIDQTVPFIPDPDTIAKYEAVLKNAAPKGIRYTEVSFKCYDRLHAVEPPRSDPDTALLLQVLKSMCGSSYVPCGDGCSGCPVRALMDAAERKLAPGKEAGANA